MKKFIIGSVIVIAALLLFDYAYYELGIFINLNPHKEVTTFIKTDGKQILLNPVGGGLMTIKNLPLKESI